MHLRGAKCHKNTKLLRTRYVSQAPNMHQISFLVEALSRTLLGELKMLTTSPSLLGRGYPDSYPFLLPSAMSRSGADSTTISSLQIKHCIMHMVHRGSQKYNLNTKFTQNFLTQGSHTSTDIKLQNFPGPSKRFSRTVSEPVNVYAKYSKISLITVFQ